MIFKKTYLDYTALYPNHKALMLTAPFCGRGFGVG